MNGSVGFVADCIGGHQSERCDYHECFHPGPQEVSIVHTGSQFNSNACKAAAADHHQEDLPRHAVSTGGLQQGRCSQGPGTACLAAAAIIVMHLGSGTAVLPNGM